MATAEAHVHYLSELAGAAIGGLFNVVAKDFDLPGLRRGVLVGWLAYLVSLLIYWAQ